MGNDNMEFDHLHALRLVGELFRLTDELQKMTSQPFTPDGHLVGSLGEVFAASAYELELEPPSTKACDARDKNGKRCEIKATFGNRVAFRRHNADCEPHYCLVLRLKKDADFDEIYNGPMRLILDKLEARALPSNGQLQISLAQLQVLNAQVHDEDRLHRADTESQTRQQ
jgi:hypothetical protein